MAPFWAMCIIICTAQLRSVLRSNKGENNLLHSPSAMFMAPQVASWTISVLPPVILFKVGLCRCVTFYLSSCGNILYFIRLEEISCLCSVVSVRCCFQNTFISCCVWFCGYKEWGYWRVCSDGRTERSPVSASFILLYFLHHFVRLLVTDMLRDGNPRCFQGHTHAHLTLLFHSLSSCLCLVIWSCVSPLFLPPPALFVSISSLLCRCLTLSCTATHSLSFCLWLWADSKTISWSLGLKTPEAVLSDALR